MRRFYLPPTECRPDHLVLTENEAHHAADVLRVRKGEEVVVLDGAGGEYICAVETVARKRVELRVKNKFTQPHPPCEITLVQAIPKGKLLDAIIQKATELGVWRIIPLLSKRVTTHLEGDSAEHKSDKWRHTAIEAIKQCGQRWLPQVESAITLPELLKRGAQFDLALVGSLQSDSRHLRVCFPKQLPRSLCLWIGPEGDLAPEELQAIQASGALPITLGSLTLRCETAAICALSVINYELTAPRDA